MTAGRWLLFFAYPTSHWKDELVTMQHHHNLPSAQKVESGRPAIRPVMSSKCRRRSVSAVTAAVVLAVVALMTSPTAYAATNSWTWSHSNGNHIMHAEYFDAQNVLTVDDQDVDGHSAFVVLHNDSNHTEYTCWDHSGATGAGSSCAMPSSYLENKRLWAQLCIGEWAKNSADWVTISCSSVTHSFLS